MNPEAGKPPEVGISGVDGRIKAKRSGGNLGIRCPGKQDIPSYRKPACYLGRITEPSEQGKVSVTVDLSVFLVRFP